MDKIELHKEIVKGTNQGVMKDHLLFKELHDHDFKKEILSNPIHHTYLKEIKDTADKYRKIKITVLPFWLFKQFDTTGIRKNYENVYFERRGRLLTFALMAWLYNNSEDIKALEDIIWAICDEYTWSLPAHLYSKSLEPELQTNFWDNKMKKTDLNPETNIDLFAAETGFALSEILFMLEEFLSPIVVHRARKEIFRRVLISYLEYPGIYNWEQMKNNWCGVCASSIGIAGIYLIEDDEILAQLISRLSPTLERFVESFEADGTCLEGLSYWTYGVGFYVAFSDLLNKRTMGGIDLLKTNELKKIAAFQHKCYFPNGLTVSFSDANQKDQFRSGLTSYLKSKFSNVKMISNQYAAGFLSDPCFRWCHSIRDLIWTVKQGEEEANDVDYQVLEHAQWMLCKQYTGHCLGLAVKGGHNDEPHNHNDVGSFIFYKDGECLLADLGSGEYTKDYFGAGRYDIFCNNSLFHNVPIINNEGQKEGREHCAKEIVFEGSNRMIMDISGAYDNKDLIKLIREIAFIEGEGIFLSDTFKVTKGIKKITERLITLYKPVIKINTVVINGEKTACSIRYDPNIMSPSINRHDHIDHKGNHIAVYSIDFNVVNVSSTVICKLEIR